MSTEQAPADRLREAAQKVRKTAWCAGGRGSWEAFRQHTQAGYDTIGVARDWEDSGGGETVIFTDPSCHPQEATHIAMWSPPVALLVADWLEATAEGLTKRGVTARIKPHERVAFAVADQILGAS